MIKKYSLFFLCCVSFTGAQPPNNALHENIREMAAGFALGFSTGAVPVAGTIALPYLAVGTWENLAFTLDSQRTTSPLYKSCAVAGHLAALVTIMPLYRTFMDS